MLDIPPPPASISALSATMDRARGQEPGRDDGDDVSVMVVNSSDEEQNGWKSMERRGRKQRESHLRVRRRRRTTSASERSSDPSSPLTPSLRQPVNERTGGLVEGDMGESPDTSTMRMTRSRTLPVGRARGAEGGSTSGEEGAHYRNVLRKGKAGRGSVLYKQQEYPETKRRTRDDSGGYLTPGIGL